MPVENRAAKRLDPENLNAAKAHRAKRIAAGKMLYKRMDQSSNGMISNQVAIPTVNPGACQPHVFDAPIKSPN